MRAISEALATKLATGVTTLAHVWCVERRDGLRFAFTDHDRALCFDDLIAEPAEALVTGSIEKSVGLAPDSASISGVLSSEAITEADIARGLWDSARFDIFRVDWSSPEDRVHLFCGRLGEVRRGVSAFEAEVRGLQAALNVPVGRVFSRFCDADLGDGRCGIDINAPGRRGEGIVTEVLGSQAFRASGLAGFAAHWFAGGRIVWASGDRGEVATHRSEGGESVLELMDVTPLELGATFVIHAGCDKRIETCRDKFSNAVNFRGFPHMPGNDALQAGPQADDRLDGSSRLA